MLRQNLSEDAAAARLLAGMLEEDGLVGRAGTARPRPGASKQELYEKARRLAIEGRSQMTRAELERAIAQRS